MVSWLWCFVVASEAAFMTGMLRMKLIASWTQETGERTGVFQGYVSVTISLPPDFTSTTPQ